MSLKRECKAGPRKATEPLSKRGPQFAANATTVSQAGDLASAVQRGQRLDRQGAWQGAWQKGTSGAQVAQLEVQKVSQQSSFAEIREEVAGIREKAAEIQEKAQINTSSVAQTEACQAADFADQAGIHQDARLDDQAKVHQTARPADQAVARSGEGKSLRREGRRARPSEDQKTSAETSSRQRKKRPSAKPSRRIVLWVIAFLCLVLVCISALFCWHRWLRYDDLADFQGEWSVEGTSGTISIDAEVICLTSADEFSYELDTGSKTLSISFGNLEGNARYRFSLDRTQLVIQDGSYDFFTSLLDDIVWTFASLFSLLTGQEAPALAFDESSQVLTRVGSNTDNADVSADESSSDSSTTDASEEDTTETSGEGETEEAVSDTSSDDVTETSSSDTSITDALSSGDENEVGSNVASPEDVQ